MLGAFDLAAVSADEIIVTLNLRDFLFARPLAAAATEAFLHNRHANHIPSRPPPCPRRNRRGVSGCPADEVLAEVDRAIYAAKQA